MNADWEKKKTTTTRRHDGGKEGVMGVWVNGQILTNGFFGGGVAFRDLFEGLGI
jgi:hypothetical protein